MKRNAGVDFIKVLACISVVGLHTIDRDSGRLNYFCYYLCGWAIPLFMMSSGYFLFADKEKLTQAYIGKKIVHILRFSFLWSGILTCYSLAKTILSNGISFTNMWGEFAQIPTNTVLNLLQKGNAPVMWYCGSLILLYAFAYLFKARDMKPVSVWLCAFGVGIIIQISSYCLKQPLQSAFTQTFRLWTWIQYAMLGAMMPRISEFIRERVSWLAHFALILVIVPALVCYQIYMGKNFIHNSYVEFFYDSVSMILIVVLVFSFAVRCFSKQNKNSVICLLSRLSVGVFVLHLPVFYSVAGILPGNTSKLGFARFFLVIIGTFLLAFAISKTKPGKYLLKI